MPRSIIVLIVVAVLLVGGTVLLSMKGGSNKEPTRVDKEVRLDNLAN
jgi:hypothetical protein